MQRCCVLTTPKVPPPHLLAGFDAEIITVQETWTTADLALDGYSTFKVAALPANGPRRPKGGQGILISTTFNTKYVGKCPLSQFAVAVSLSWEGGSLIIINAYLASLSKIADTKQIWEFLEQYVLLLILDHPDAMVLLMGDLNACLGSDDP